MKIVLQTVNFKAGSALEKFIFDKVGQLRTLGADIVRAEVVLNMDHAEAEENKICELHLITNSDTRKVKTLAKRYEKSVTDAVKSMQELIAGTA